MRLMTVGIFHDSSLSIFLTQTGDLQSSPYFRSFCPIYVNLSAIYQTQIFVVALHDTYWLVTYSLVVLDRCHANTISLTASLTCERDSMASAQPDLLLVILVITE